ncbi:MAG: ABC transporter permease [Bacteroidetes bacterium]|nr:MAG: ABC transporter permease [Bacteroidota bacterium]
MNLFKLSWSNLTSRPLSALLSLLLLTLGVSIISLLLLLNEQTNRAFNKNVKDIDMVVGAKGSPLQLILSSVYHIDNPTGNIPMQEAMSLARNPVIEKAIPLAYGDSYRSYRIVGTDTAYLGLYDARLADGRLWQAPFEVVAGATVARILGLQTGDTFFGSHGLVDDANVHDAHPYRVVGVLQPSGSVLDQLILTSIESVWGVHESHEEEAAADGHEEEAPKEITALLVKFRNKGMGMFLPRTINQNTSMQAALTAIEINKLRENLGIGIVIMRAVAMAIIIISAISVFISLYNALKDRKYEMALMRSLGASSSQLFVMVLLEGMMLAGMGLVLGLLVSRGGMLLLSQYASQQYHYEYSAFVFMPEEGLLAVLTLFIGLLAATIPAVRAFNINISQTLADA